MSRHSPASAQIRPHEGRLEPPRLMFFGDPHGEFGSIVEAVQRERPQAIVLLGDLQAERPLHVELAAIGALTEIWFIHGNHDTDDERYFDHLWGSELATRNLHGRVVRIASCLVAGLGGIFRESVWDPAVPAIEARFASARALRRATPVDERWRGGVSLRHRSTIFPDELERLASRRADILVTHEGLAGTPHGHLRLNEFALAMQVKLVVHGHLHRDIDYQREGRLAEDSPFRAYGVDQGSHLSWPPRLGAEAPCEFIFGNLGGRQYTKGGWKKTLSNLMTECARVAAERGQPFTKFNLQDCRPAGVTERLYNEDVDVMNATLHTSPQILYSHYDRRRTRVSKATK